MLLYVINECSKNRDILIHVSEAVIATTAQDISHLSRLVTVIHVNMPRSLGLFHCFNSYETALRLGTLCEGLVDVVAFVVVHR
jgi:hypothetical protein